MLPAVRHDPSRATAMPVGARGLVSGPHLHVGQRTDRRRCSPYKLLSASTGSGLFNFQRFAMMTFSDLRALVLTGLAAGRAVLWGAL